MTRRPINKGLKKRGLGVAAPAAACQGCAGGAASETRRSINTVVVNQDNADLKPIQPKPALFRLSPDEVKLYIARNSMNDAISLRFIRSIFQDFGGYELMSPVAGRWPVNDQPVFITCKEGKGDQMAYLNVEGDNVLGIRYFTATSTMPESVRKIYECQLTFYGDFFALVALGRLDIRSYWQFLLDDIKSGAINVLVSGLHVCADFEDMTTAEIWGTRKVLCAGKSKDTSHIAIDPVTGLSGTCYDGQKGDPVCVSVYNKMKEISDDRKHRLYEQYWGKRIVSRLELSAKSEACRRYAVTLEKCLKPDFLLSFLKEHLRGKYVKWQICHFIEEEVRQKGVEAYELERIKPVHGRLSDNEYYRRLMRRNLTGAKHLGRKFQLLLKEMLFDYEHFPPPWGWE